MAGLFPKIFQTLFMVLMSLGMVLSGCQNITPPPGPAPAPVTPAPVPPVVPTTAIHGGVTYQLSSFFVGVDNPANTSMILHQDQVLQIAAPAVTNAIAWSTPCTATAGQEVACILEAEEFDLYFMGLTLAHNFPAGMCKYVEQRPYFYHQYEPAIGRTTVTLNVAANLSAAIGAQAGGVGSKGTASTPGSGTNVFCAADYRSIGGPNCCVGNYVLTTNTTDALGAVTTVVSNLKWGGNPNDCLVGPGVDSQTKTSEHYPMATVQATLGNAVSGAYAISSPYSKSFATNAYISNFFAPIGLSYAFSSAGVPLAQLGPATGGALSPTSYPLSSAANISTGNPYYEYVCMNSAEDVIARIRVLIRTWSKDNEFLLQAGGNPDVAGAETAFADQGFLDRKSWPGTGWGILAYPAGGN